ncbi:LPS export ABC transporter permease LptG [Dasania sp. GY-MA-18]|uniref:LPS export ABC transporter permease LptG n=1 Tax=Dasania phycosphaerae TaxID=2950436 RepID=A0A9J6RMM3_9GAMM|nr:MULTISPECIES: LPS export ABC transporter permease LptG [Dasania]MCR8923292.1 LPS export ABC transporter permease LptG [Dasania sp. GY-MA-18]MCZ0865724.1 LPS export ABC transporter permease LptG [Dasania phycosphaerae]MCZ0869449.1 LPS export ABC transporter permease LptG [Dasania phycosphaerae]
MKKLNRYVSQVVGSAILMVLLVIIGLDAIASIIDEMENIKAGYTFWAVLKFVLYSVPGDVYEFLPFAALVGSLAGLGALANNSELVVIRSAGVSTGRILWMVMRPALLITALGFLISEYVAPHTESIAKSERGIALRGDANVVSREGLWHREGNNYMHFDVVQPNGVLYGVNIYQYNDKRELLVATQAERAIYQQGHWLLEDIAESYFTDGQVATQRFASRQWQTDLSPELLSILVLDPLDLSVQGLWDYSRYLELQGLNNGSYLLAFWKKVLQPLSTLTLVLVAISFIFGPLREVTMGFRVFVGVLVGIVFRTTQDMLGPASLVYGFEPIYASGIPILICALFGVVLLRRAA